MSKQPALTWAAVVSKPFKPASANPRRAGGQRRRNLPTPLAPPPPTPPPSPPPAPTSVIPAPAETYEEERRRLWREEQERNAPPPKTEEELVREEVEQKLEGWPWASTSPPIAFTLAPFLDNTDYIPETSPKVLQDSRFFKLLDNDVVCENLLKYILQRHDTATRYALICRRTMESLGTQIGWWDFNQSFFQDCHKARDDPTVREGREGFVSPVVIISPIRGTFFNDINKLRPEQSKSAMRKSRAKAEKRWRVISSDDDYKPIYPGQLRSLAKMCLSTKNFADYFQHIQFHRIPFLTVEILELIIPNMRKLKQLGVFRCPLIHVGHALELFELIKRDRPVEKERRVNLEFFPNRHTGPISAAGNSYHTGEYGVTWDNFNGRSDLAIWALVFKILRQARRYGIDIQSEDTAFRQWLDKSPCWRVGETLQKMNEFIEHKISELELIAYIDFRKYRGNSAEISRYRQYEFNAEGWEWLAQTQECVSCAEPTLGIFWDFGSWRSRFVNHYADSCLGCRLVDYLNGEDDHFKLRKRSIMQDWLFDGEEWNITNLPKALEDFEKRDILSNAWWLDDQRRKQYCFAHPDDRYDPEYEERQRPWTRGEQTKLGRIIRAPFVTEADADLKQMKLNTYEWNRMEETRKWAHGHGSR
ncbi:hypothetical protein B0O99DRAFT_78860 [Bisporella sp. PMI_857]|nr:hypothetical protein B0O99DRAFT_78860 [Bisporella sp. PMI_857]